MTALQIASLLFVILYYGLLLAFRGYLLYKRTGINPISHTHKEGLAGYIENVFLVCFILVSVIAGNYVFIPQNYLYLVPIEYLDSFSIGLVGICLAFSGLGLAFIAQLEMGDAWRLGLDKRNKTELIQEGLYKYSRNPIYLGILIGILGFFLMMPNAVSLCLLITTYLALGVKIRLEEQHLIQMHSETYLAYKNNVRRWL